MVFTAGKVGRNERPVVRFGFIADSHCAPHEGSWREIGGVAYFTSPASVFDDAGVSEAHSLVEVFSSGAIRVRLFQWKESP